MTQISPDRLSLLPWPASVRTLEAPALPQPARLDPGYRSVRTPRLEHALRALRTRGRAAAGTPLLIDCDRISARFPEREPDESYRLEIDRSGIRIAAAEEWGVLRGVATLSQLLASGDPLPALAIEDRPRFPWRGLMLDVARHFLPLDLLLRTIERMAAVKLNVLHLHLSDDQAFRFPSEAYPRLASAQHYRRAELCELVEHAADHGVRVIPELDMPGHTASWLAAYPEWGPRAPVPAAASTRFGVHRECLDPGNPEVYRAIDALLREVAAVFPDDYLHIGGDEVHPEWWSTSPAVTAFMQQQRIPDVAALQARFNREVAALVTGLGRRPLGWDEVLHPDAPPSFTVQAWRGATARDRALRAGHDCVVSAHYYLDLMYPADLHYAFDPAAPESELLALEDALPHDPRMRHVAAGIDWTRHWRDVPDTSTHLGTDPAAGADMPGRGRLLGAEACLWAELVDAATLDVRLWGRLPALAERFWSTPDACRPAQLPGRLAAVQRWLAQSLDLDLAARSTALYRRAGVTDAWLPLVALLEPVKWYGRLLGEAALNARTEGRELPELRPYSTTTPLDRVIDALPTECPAGAEFARHLAAWRAGDAAARQQLRATAVAWCGIPGHGAGPDELEPLAAAARQLGGILLDLLDARLSASAAREALAPLRRPYGEYLLGPALLLDHWLESAAVPPPSVTEPDR